MIRVWRKQLIKVVERKTEGHPYQSMVVRRPRLLLGPELQLSGVLAAFWKAIQAECKCIWETQMIFHPEIFMYFQYPPKKGYTSSDSGAYNPCHQKPSHKKEEKSFHLIISQWLEQLRVEVTCHIQSCFRIVHHLRRKGF